jgi:hypothetical protein
VRAPGGVPPRLRVTPGIVETWAEKDPDDGRQSRQDTGPSPAASLNNLGLYHRYVFRHLLDIVMASKVYRVPRRRTLAAAGRILAIGFGTGTNLRHYPASVQRIDAINPDADLARLVSESGLALGQVKNYYLKHVPRLAGYMTKGGAPRMLDVAQKRQSRWLESQDISAPRRFCAAR